MSKVGKQHELLSLETQLMWYLGVYLFFGCTKCLWSFPSRRAAFGAAKDEVFSGQFHTPAR